MPYEDIFNQHPLIACHVPRWKKNRDFVDGEDAVKRMGLEYLPLANPDDSPAAYKAHLERTGFFPAASKTQQGWSGLISRKPSHLNTTSTSIQTLAQLITPHGENLEEFCEWVVGETLITNFTGILVDHPPVEGFTGLNAANAYALGYRPFLTGYAAETILEVTPGLVANRRQLVRVRLLEACGTQVRELMLNSGVYQYRIWTKTDDGLTPGPIQTPTANGKPLSEIPFVLVSNSDKLTPRPSLLQHVVDLNLQHYRVSGLHTSVLYFLSAPIPVVTGFNPDTGEETAKPVTLSVAPGAAWIFPEPDTKAEYLEFKGQGASEISDKMKELKDELRIAGHSVIAPDKDAPESPETQMIYRAAETSILSGFTRTVSTKIERALKFFARFADPVAETDLTFILNTDFVPQPLSAQEHAEIRNDWQAGLIPQEVAISTLQAGEVYGPALDPSTVAEAAKAEVADRPALGAL